MKIKKKEMKKRLIVSYYTRINIYNDVGKSINNNYIELDSNAA